jgi:hypothetical protein
VPWERGKGWSVVSWLFRNRTVRKGHKDEQLNRRKGRQQGHRISLLAKQRFAHARFAQLTSSLKNSVFVTFVIFVYCELFRFVMREALDDLGLFSQFGDELFYAVYPNASFSWLWGFDFLNF